jgi:hypothetical protein
MKKFDISPKNFKKFPLDYEEHEELPRDLLKAQQNYFLIQSILSLKYSSVITPSVIFSTY